jgi:NADH-quinone oxidoreductase subunit J
MTIIAAVGTVSSQRPVYCAIWFALTLFGVGSLLLINGAQFLAVATVAIYAGAIVVTLLFVLMLAQPEGHTPYDRISWGRLAQWLACFAGAASTCLLVWAFLQTPLPTGAVVATKNPTLTTDHVAALGAVMFSRYLIAVELGGLLLFAALVGAVSIAAIPSRDLDRQLDQALGGPASAGAVPHE